MVILAATAIAIGAESGYDLFQKALVMERTEGKLTEAIEAYKQIVEKYPGDRKLAAKALMQMAQCYERLGHADARKTYEQLLRQYADQNEVAADARARLAALERAGDLSHPSGITLRKVWADVGGVVEGSPSPDGRHLSFTDWETGDLAVRDLLSGKNRRLTAKGTWKDSDEYAEASAISGDGRQVAFAWFNKEDYYELRVVGIDGSKPRVVFRDKEVGFFVEPYQWTADGKQILVALQKSKEETRIALVPAAGGPARVLKTLVRYPWYASLSPDGRFLVYDAPGPDDGKERDVFLFSVAGGREIPLVRHPADDFAAVWTLEGNKVLFVSDRTGTNGFWIIDVVDGKPQGSPQLLKNGVGRRIRPNGFTRQGSFYYSLSADTQDVYGAEVDPAAGKVLRQPAPVAARFVGSNSAPSWSPDGRRLAYYSQRSDSPLVGGPTLVIHSVETDEERDVTVGLLQTPYPVRWFPDGKSVLVGAWDSPKRDQVAFYRVDLQTGDHRLIRSSPGHGPVCSELSPDGKTLFFFTGGEPKLRGGIISRDIETGQEREVARVPYMAGGGFARLTVSPDGKYLAFRSPVDEAKWTALRLVPVTGGESRELYRFRQSETAGSDELAWTPDGRNVLMVRGTGKDGMPELWRIPIVGGEPQRTGLSMKGMRLVAAHPDGRRIAFDNGRRGEGPSEVWVLENLPAAAESKAVARVK
jgi:Tol biopolymer transport system component